MKDGLTNPAPDGYPKYFGYRSKEPTMHLTFHNVGTEPVTAPTIKLKLEQREPSLSHGDELLTAFTGKATGEDWNCKGSTASITCMSKAEIAPGDSLPTIEVGLRALDTGPRTHFTATLDDLQYEAVLYYDTST